MICSYLLRIAGTLSSRNYRIQMKIIWSIFQRRHEHISNRTASIWNDKTIRTVRYSTAIWEERILIEVARANTLSPVDRRTHRQTDTQTCRCIDTQVKRRAPIAILTLIWQRCSAPVVLPTSMNAFDRC